MRSCEKCGTGLERTVYPSGKREALVNFARRRFCSRTCSGGAEMGVSAIDRFKAKVREDESGCWLWTGHRTPQGYGRFRSDQGRLAHRFAYAFTHGPIPDGMVVDHACRQPSCVNPSHLRLLTHADNSRYQAVRIDNVSGYRGVRQYQSGRWGAGVTHEGKRIHVGTFDTPEEAAEAARAARIAAWGAHLEVGHAAQPCPTLPLEEIQ